jgi:hypothetical protein
LITLRKTKAGLGTSPALLHKGWKDIAAIFLYNPD